MDYRHELKYYINKKDAFILMQRLSSILRRDEHCGDSGYVVTSLYFDNVYLSSYYQKLNGVFERDKIRIRAYDYSKDFIRLEVKNKMDAYIKKQSSRITFEDYENIVCGKMGLPFDSLHQNNPAINKYLVSAHLSMLKPVVIVDYLRHAFVGPGGLRVSFDFDLRLAFPDTDMFSPENHYLKAIPDDTVILEVKYTSYLPTYISSMINGISFDKSSISKYIFCMDKLKEIKYHA